MDDCLAIEELLKITRSLVIAKERKDALLKSLIYFKEQMHSSETRRDPQDDLCRAFRQLEALATEYHVLSQFKQNRAWLKTQRFCGIAVQPTTKQKELLPEIFLRDLLNRVQRHDFENPQDRWLLVLGVRALLLESEMPRPRREQKILLPIWLAIWPRLKFHGFLKDIERDRIFKDRWSFFLKGNFGTEPDQFRKRGTPLR